MSKQPQSNPRVAMMVRAAAADSGSQVNPDAQNAYPKMMAADERGVIFVRAIGFTDQGDTQADTYIEGNADDISDNLFGLVSASFQYAFNDEANSWDRIRTANSDDVGSRTGRGVMLTSGPGQWSVTDAAAENAQAQAVQAAPGANRRNVIQNISGTITGTVAGPAGLTVQVLDGVTVIWEEHIQVVIDVTTAGSAGMGRVSMSGLNIPCAENAAATIQFSAAGGANTFESVNMSGYTTQVP